MVAVLLKEQACSLGVLLDTSLSLDQQSTNVVPSMALTSTQYIMFGYANAYKQQRTIKGDISHPGRNVIPRRGQRQWNEKLLDCISSLE